MSRLSNLLQGTLGKEIVVHTGDETPIRGKVVEAWPEFIVMDVPAGAAHPGVRHVFVEHIRWLMLAPGRTE